ncbi:pentatricopeptide repeat-containing protein At1g31430-like [Phragmites australis]|uniref:pentatricopeptide repeat-containing protein At1g31430-like n=1 Tax=Phragmites australis TaxID=29695 RepID=UPI002D78DE5A|nr:pentatricopeptide repeat-containing protein At1g31430-like [Phragmites australis]XP_062221537.1 pentatricopeptide repeat-containing protein At1g31430-like [Phragmites australis]
MGRRTLAAAPGGFLHLSLLASLRRRPSLQAHAQLLLLGLPLPAAAASRLLRPHLRAGHPLASLRLFLRILRDHEPSLSSTASEEPVPNSYSLSAALAACSRHASPSPGFSIHAFLLKSGFASNLFAANSLLHFYASFGLHSLARKLFDEMLERDFVSFNTLIGSYVQSGCIDGALGMFRNMVELGFRWDGWTVTGLLAACAGLGDLRVAKAAHGVARRALKLELFNSGEVVIVLVDMYVKCGAVRLARRVFDLSGEKARNVRVWTAMMSGHAKAGEIDMARRLFDEMHNRDLVAWTVLVGGFVQAGRYSEALGLFEEMEAAGLEADEVTVVTILSACAHHGRIDLAKRLHRLVDQKGLISRNARLATSFVHMYAKHGCIQTAIDVFHGVGDALKTVELFNAMINGFAHHGFGDDAISLFHEMGSLGLHPDEITFVGVLCACSHSGLVQQGFQMFNSMADKYGVKPDIKHYACMADLLGRVGRLDDAYSFIQNMPFKANCVVWSSLLRACRIHRNDKIGKLAEKHLGRFNITYNPEKLTLPDLFSDEKRKGPAARVRKAIMHKSEHRHTQLAEKQLLEYDVTRKLEKLTLSDLFSDEKRKEPAARVRKTIKHKSEHEHTQLAEKQLLEFGTNCKPEKLTLSDLFS